VARVKRESAGLLRAAADNNVKPTTSEIPSPAADGFGAEHAVTLAAAIPTVRFFLSRFVFLEVPTQRALVSLEPRVCWLTVRR